ncbi:putative monocarboxylate permease-like protein [Botrytis fragariae]|uniref:Putative monocarboxylate permease-like protein n=1 Tax=Botrytis fragariae TaxID=1964551 RepID=A0A8H6EF32_9HELO|nr:putative monocarboxylate permease-like protein [Botrytis fragariae]KAF5869999.1 putative monocarboxylate permease-like protein [Botrytis fragariae]
MESAKTHKAKGDPTSTGRPVDSDVDIERSVEKAEIKNERSEGVQSEAEKQNAFIMDFPDGGARAWSVAAGAAGVLFCTFGYINAFGVYQEYYQTHQLSHRSPSDISWIGSLQVFFLFSGSAVGGPLFDRYGGGTIWPAALLYVFSVMMTSLCKEYYQFMLAQGILGGVATGMTMAPGMTAVGQYFNKKRGAAMGITVAGSSVGGVIFPIALAKIPWNLLHNYPSAITPRKKSFFLPAAFKELPYITLLVSAFLMMLGVFIPIFYLPSYAVQYGMSTELASYLISILNGASFFGRVIPGILADKIGRLNMLCAVGVSTGILVFCWQSITSSAGIIVFAAIYGFCSGAIVSLVTLCLAMVPENPQNIGTYMGMGMFVTAFAALIGPPINGALVEHYHSFDQVADFSGVVVLVGGLFVLVIKVVEGGILKRV